jgi:hypothetical protein
MEVDDDFAGFDEERDAGLNRRYDHRVGFRELFTADRQQARDRAG